MLAFNHEKALGDRKNSNFSNVRFQLYYLVDTLILNTIKIPSVGGGVALLIDIYDLMMVPFQVRCSMLVHYSSNAMSKLNVKINQHLPSCVL